jgi:primary-amine oxidase
MLGVSGQLDASRDSSSNTGWALGPSGATRYATNRFHTSYWRLDFALGGQNNDLFQQLNYTAGTANLTYNQSITNITTENKFTISPENHRFWLVKDTVISNSANGQKISYEIVPANTSVHRGSDPLTNADIYVTQGGVNNTCEQFATLNPANPGYPNGTQCLNNVTQFVNGETITDPVVWAGTTWHQIPRAEDESNSQMHWQGIILAPRDLTATSPFN